MKKIVITISALLLIVLGTFILARTVVFPIKHKEEIKKYAKMYNVDPTVVAAVIHFETNFDSIKYEEGKKVGLMKITDKAGIEMSKKIGEEINEPKVVAEPDTNIKLGTWYIANNGGDKNFNDMMARWSFRNGEEYDKFTEDYARKYFGERIEKRVKIYKFLYPEL